MSSPALLSDRRLWVLRNFDLFKALTDDELFELASASRLIEFGKNSHVCMSGVQHTHAYLIKEGNVRLVMTHPNGKRLTLGILKPGELIGDIELLSNSLALGESAETMGPVTLYAVPLDVLRKLITNKPEFTLTISKIVGDRRTEIINRMQDVLFMTVPQRLSRLLLKLAEDFPGQTKSGRRFLNLKITHAELADLIGANREAVSSTLAKWKTAKIAESVKGYIVLRDEVALTDQ